MPPHSRSPLARARSSRNCEPRWTRPPLSAPAQSTTAAPADPAQSREAAAHLTTLLSDSIRARLISSRRITRRCARCSTTRAWREFEQLVQGYAFADAQARLEQALESFRSIEGHFRIPRHGQNRTVLRPHGASDVKDLSDSRILIVDDVKANVDILVEALRDEYKLSVALDGAAALRSIEKNPPDLVLLDIVMPGLDGYEVCRQLRAREPTREVPVMFLSALEDVKNKAQGFEVGGNDYLTKPFEVLEVKARVRSLLKAKAYADAVREAMARDLRIAREIQMGILPADLAAATKGTGLDVHAVIEPAP